MRLIHLPILTIIGLCLAAPPEKHPKRAKGADALQREREREKEVFSSSAKPETEDERLKKAREKKRKEQEVQLKEEKEKPIKGMEGKFKDDTAGKLEEWLSKSRAIESGAKKLYEEVEQKVNKIKLPEPKEQFKKRLKDIKEKVDSIGKDIKELESIAGKDCKVYKECQEKCKDEAVCKKECPDGHKCTKEGKCDQTVCKEPSELIEKAFGYFLAHYRLRAMIKLDVSEIKFDIAKEEGGDEVIEALKDFLVSIEKSPLT